VSQNSSDDTKKQTKEDLSYFIIKDLIQIRQVFFNLIFNYYLSLNSLQKPFNKQTIKYGMVAVIVTAQPIDPMPLKTPKNTIIQAIDKLTTMCI
jgi:hypothetical protein